MLIAEGFNRHDQYWGGDRAASTCRQGEVEGVLAFIHELDL